MFHPATYTNDGGGDVQSTRGGGTHTNRSQSAIELNNLNDRNDVGGPRRFSSANQIPGHRSSIFGFKRRPSRAPKLRRRLVFKNGDCNISATNVAQRKARYLADIFTTLVDIEWRWTITLFAGSFCISWFFFAALWWLVALSHGDLDPKNHHEAFKTCVLNVHNFSTSLLFSIETQTTIGYGFRHTTDACVHGVMLMMVQSVFGVILQAFMAGIVFSKLSRPVKRAETLMFSRSAVISMRDGKLCLMIRIADMRKSHILEAHIRGILIKKKVTLEGEVLPLYQHDVNLQMECNDNQVYMFWPLIAVHVIDEDSPLYEISQELLVTEKFELIVILEGVVESTGMNTQAKTSYLPSEILWGFRFNRLITYHKGDGAYQIDYSLFDDLEEALDTPTCSAKELDMKGWRSVPPRDSISVTTFGSPADRRMSGNSLQAGLVHNPRYMV